MTQLRINRTADPDSSLVLDSEAAVLLVRSRLTNYPGPFIVDDGSERTFEDCGTAVSKALEALSSSSNVTVGPRSKPSVAWELSQVSQMRTREEVRAQLETEDELIPETEA